MVRNIVEYLQKSAKEYPNKIAVRDANNQLSFEELDRQAKGLATLIIDTIGEGKNRPIAVYMKKSVQCIVAFLGIAYSGNYYSPIDIQAPKERTILIKNALKPVCVITNEMGEKTIGEAFDEVPVVLIEKGAKTDGNVECLERIAQTRLDIDPLYVLFTSGSTGVPKGVIISQAGVIDYAEWLADTFEFDENTVFGEQAPFYFDNSVLDIYSTLRNGATMVIIPEEYFTFPAKLFEFLQENKVNTIFWVPSALVGVANSGILEKTHLNSLDKVLFCGEVMPTKQYNMWKKNYPNVLFANLYGPTEITDVCAYYIIQRELKDDEPIPIGKACKNTEILVLNNDNQLVKEGEIGELCVRGIGNSMGYYGVFDKTDAVFVQNPLNSLYYDKIYRTGDLVKYNRDGELVYICRKDFQIKHQGHRIELGEIEAVVSSFDEVKQCCAIYDENAKKIVMFCSLHTEITKKEIYQEMKGRLPKYMLPGDIVIKEDLPLNLNGKIDRVLLKQEITIK